MTRGFDEWQILRDEATSHRDVLRSALTAEEKDESPGVSPGLCVERTTGIEPATFTLAR